MSFADQLRAAAQSPTAAWHQFTLLYKQNSTALFLFLEGELDVPFYLSAVKQVFGQEVHVHDLRCGGRQGVLDAWHRVSITHPAAKRCLYFVDRDFTSFLGQDTPSFPEIFCTKWYSIENYAVGVDALQIVWTHCWLLPSSDKRWELLLPYFEKALRRFHRKMAPLMAWVVLAKASGLRPNLNNVKLARFLSISADLEPTLGRGAYDVFRKDVNCDFRPGVTPLRYALRALTRANAKSYVRGKFEMDFFVQFLRQAFALLRLTKPQPDAAINLSAQSVMIALAGKLALPEDLRLFLQLSKERIDATMGA